MLQSHLPTCVASPRRATIGCHPWHRKILASITQVRKITYAGGGVSETVLLQWEICIFCNLAFYRIIRFLGFARSTNFRNLTAPPNYPFTPLA